MLDFLDKCIELFGKDRKTVASVAQNGQLEYILPQFPIRTNPCNLDVSGFHSITMYAISMMHYKLELPLAELVGLMSAVEVVPNSRVHFAITCNIFLFYAGCCEGQIWNSDHILNVFKP